MLNYFLELRRRLLSVGVIFLVLFGLYFYFAPELFHLFMSPLLTQLPKNSSLIATQITTPLLTPLNLAANAALLCTMPYALFHFWRFIQPALYRQERATLGWVILLSFILFLLGGAFGFYIMLPYMLNFFIKALPQGVQWLPDMGPAADFITHMLIIFGLCFQVPLICLVLVKFNVVKITTLQQVRPYMIVLAFTLGMLLTPPDVVSQIMVALPLCLLYESGLFLTQFLAKRAFSVKR